MKQSEQEDNQSMLQAAKNRLQEGEFTCVVLGSEGQVVLESKERGVSPLLTLLQKDKNAICGCYVADKIIGKAAACLMVLGKAKACFGFCVSESAQAFFLDQHMNFSFETVVAYVENRTKTGSCPMELAVKDKKTAQEGYEAILTFLASMQKR